MIGFAMFSRGHIHDKTIPVTIQSWGALEFIQEVLSGEPPLFRPFRLSFRLFLRLPLWPPLRLMPPTFRPPVLVGTCYVTRPVIIVDTSGHVLLGSYSFVYKVPPSVGILILSSLRIPPLGA
jgi:hypothetical protein